MDTFTQRERSRIMAAVKTKDTTPELAVRRLGHRLGYRFRLHVRTLPGTPDIVLPRGRRHLLAPAFIARFPDLVTRHTASVPGDSRRDGPGVRPGPLTPAAPRAPALPVRPCRRPLTSSPGAAVRQLCVVFLWVCFVSCASFFFAWIWANVSFTRFSASCWEMPVRCETTCAA